MYLIVFVTLAIGLISTYAQVLAVQVARAAASQTAMAQQMMAWHTAALSMAASILDTNSTGYAGFATTGCSLSYDYSYNTNYSRCPSPFLAGSPVNINLGPAFGGVIMKPSRTNTQYIVHKGSNIAECVQLSNTSCVTATGGGCGTNLCNTTFNAAAYEFNSILFNSNGTNYVVTFAAPAPGSRNLQLAAGNQIGLSTDDLLREFKILNLSTAIYGPVNGATINAAVPYNSILPTAAGVPQGSVAIVASPDGL